MKKDNATILAEALFGERAVLAQATPAVLSTCTQMTKSHLVYSVLVDGVGDFEVVMPKFLVACAMRSDDPGMPLTDENFGNSTLPTIDAFAYAMAHVTSMPKAIREYLVRLAGDERRLDALRVSAFHYLWGAYSV